VWKKLKMRSFKLFAIILAVMAISLSACKKDDEDGNNNDPENTFGSMNLKVEGEDWAAQFVIGVYEEETLTVTGSTANGNACGIIINNATQTGTYTVGQNDSDNYLSWAVGDNSINTYAVTDDMGSGTVNITKLNSTRAEGTFQFTGINFNLESVTVTEGSFGVDLSYSN
jgi:hypothetical protein